RLAGTERDGCDVLMRYTLRLLTTQQFQRAATLFCAMEHLRKKDRELLGEKRFTLGLWVGSASTPNTRKDALAKLKKLEKSPGTEENPFVLLKCPWCSAQMGPVEESDSNAKRGRGKRRNSEQPTVL